METTDRELSDDSFDHMMILEAFHSSYMKQVLSIDVTALSTCMNIIRYSIQFSQVF